MCRTYNSMVHKPVRLPMWLADVSNTSDEQVSLYKQRIAEQDLPMRSLNPPPIHLQLGRNDWDNIQLPFRPTV